MSRQFFFILQPEENVLLLNCRQEESFFHNYWINADVYSSSDPESKKSFLFSQVEEKINFFLSVKDIFLSHFPALVPTKIKECIPYV